MTTRPTDRAGAACPQCHGEMATLFAQGHYGREVELDLCEPCRLVWFDGFESVNLSGLGWIHLLENLHDAAASRQAWAGRELGCPRCSTPLKPVRNLTRYGRFAAVECPAGHGCLQSHVLLLAERGLVRPPTPQERHAAMLERDGWVCLNCGGSVQGDDDDCSWCGSPLLMFDLARLAGALRPGAADQAPASAGTALAWACHGCGQALDPTVATACGQCGHVVVAPALEDLAPLLTLLRGQWASWQAERDARRQRRQGAAGRRPRRPA